MGEGLYLYCIAPRRHVPEDSLRGLEGASVSGRRVDAFTLWTSDLPERPSPTLERIRAHNRVVAASATEDVTPLPMRFGQWFPDPRGLDGCLDGKRDRYREALEAVAGAVEFGVTIVDTSRPREAPGATARSVEVESGRAYMEQLALRRAREQAAAERGRKVAGKLHAHVGDLVRAHRATPAERDQGLSSVAHLVARQDAGRYREAVDGFREQLPELSLALAGPWPPYSFVE